jgi:uncharacterized membrane protein YfcA
MTNPLVLIILGLLVGVFSGTMGVGGGAIMIPVMILAGIVSTQTQAHGTSLAVMIPPVTLPAVIKYYREGQVDLSIALWIALGFACGSYFGAVVATSLPRETLKLLFGFVLTFIAGYTVFSWFGANQVSRSVIMALIVTLVVAAMFAVMRWTQNPAAG